MATSESAPDTSLAKETVLHVSAEPMPADSVPVKGYDFNEGVNYDKLLESFYTTGFQATNFGLAVKEINKMLDWSLADEPIAEDENEELRDMEARKKVKCRIFLGYTSNMISSGVREVIRYLCEHKMVDCIVTTCGGIEEDFMKCMANTYLGDFALPGKELRLKGRNRIGNLLIENNNYCMFENWMFPILDQMLKEQKEQGTLWSPSKIINRLGKEIDNPQSVYYWCYKNDIPVFSPAITDGSVGDMIFFHSMKNPGLIVDIASDVRALTYPVLTARKTGVVILGGGLIKHHILNANLMRNGADYSVFVNTAQEFDGSDAGARPDEAISWGKLKIDSTPVKVYAESTTIFPLLVAQTFAKRGSR